LPTVYLIQPFHVPIVYIFGYTVFSKISTNNCMYRELNYKPNTLVNSGISINFYKVVPLVIKRQFIVFGVNYIYLLFSDTVTIEYIFTLLVEASRDFFNRRNLKA
jgi:hypothetical protein